LGERERKRLDEFESEVDVVFVQIKLEMIVE